MPILEFVGLEEEYDLKPTFQPSDCDAFEPKRVKFFKIPDSPSLRSSLAASPSCHSVGTNNLFEPGVDDILYEGELMKFKPGISQNFVNRYVQISLRAFRYFRSQYESFHGKPIVAFRKNIINTAVPLKINKDSYLKKGSRIAKSGREDNLFDCAFEIELNEHYEDNYRFRDAERAIKDA